jgi:formate C-acetyltransferase
MMQFCMEVLATGIGDPAFFNDDLIAAGLRDHGVTDQDCHNYMNSTCVEIKVSVASCLVADCLATGRDMEAGGARYHWVENSFVGLANLVDSLTAVKRFVYEDRKLSLADLHRILQDDFTGHEALRQRIVNSLPKYGNDDDEVDAMACDWADFLVATTEAHTVGAHRYVPGMFCWTMHVHLGSETGATPDGRHADLPLADGAGAAQGMETRGPTASVLSTTKWSHRKVLGGLVHNAKFTKQMLDARNGRQAIRDVVETYLNRGGFEIQVNVVDRSDLLEAQRCPDRHRDLLVRVAGYSDYFTGLSEKMQNEIIARTEFGAA